MTPNNPAAASKASPVRGSLSGAGRGVVPEQLLSLAERCEAATGPDLTLDEDIRVALGLDRVCLGWGIGMVPTEEDYGAPEFTASLDAAMTLLEGLSYKAATVNWSPIGSGIAEVYLGNPWPMVGVEAATPALALCAAALRARAAA